MSLSRLPTRHPVWVLLLVAAAAVVAARAVYDVEAGARRVWFDPVIEPLLPADSFYRPE